MQEQFGDKPSERQPARSDLIVLVAHNDDPTDQMFVFFPDEGKVCLTCLFGVYLVCFMLEYDLMQCYYNFKIRFLLDHIILLNIISSRI